MKDDEQSQNVRWIEKLNTEIFLRFLMIGSTTLVMCLCLGTSDAAEGSKQITSFEAGQPLFKGDSARVVEERRGTGTWLQAIHIMPSIVEKTITPGAIHLPLDG